MCYIRLVREFYIKILTLTAAKHKKEMRIYVN